HARGPDRDRLHLEPQRGWTARYEELPGKDRLGHRGQRGRVLPAERASLGAGPMRARALRQLALSALLLVGGCGYFNSLYNANRRFADAERAAQNGDRARANREYLEAIERAAVSYRRYPDGRWADDALLLIGRARFGL